VTIVREESVIGDICFPYVYVGKQMWHRHFGIFMGAGNWEVKNRDFLLSGVSS